jgi:hypothetical protein
VDHFRVADGSAVIRSAWENIQNYEFLHPPVWRLDGMSDKGFAIFGVWSGDESGAA